MKYFHWFKGLVFVSLACAFTANGSNVETSSPKSDLQKSKVSAGYSVSVSAGQSQDKQATANLSITGESSKVNIEKEGTVTLVAGKSIHLLPGTKISAGSFLYASIEPTAKNSKHPKKEILLVTVEEKIKIEEQASLSTAAAMFSPFPSNNRRHLHAGDAEEGSFTSSNNTVSAVSPEQQRKVAVSSLFIAGLTRVQLTTNNTSSPVAISCRPEMMRVLRL